MLDSQDICYTCGNKPGVCVAPKTKEWADCAKNCTECKHHRCKFRNKCPKLYPTNSKGVKK